MAPKTRSKLLPAFIIALVFIFVNAAVSYWSLRTLSENYGRVTHSHQLLEELLSMLSAVKHAETSQRGFLLTGDEVFIGRYESSLAEVEKHLSRLEQLAVDNPDHSARVSLLRQAIQVRRDTLQRNVEMRRSEGLETIIESRGLYLGKQQMDKVLALMEEMQAEENRTLQQRQEQSEASSVNIIVTLLASNLLGLGLLFAAYYLINRFVAERRRAEAELQKAHDELEVRVIERTEDLGKANAELQRSNRELQDFAYVASHDLQEPLRKIQAFGDRLKMKHRSELSDEAGDYLDRMQSAARRMHTLINDLLTFSRVTTKAQPFVPTDLNRIAGEVLDDLEVRTQQSGGTVDVSGLPTIDADPLQMRQLFQNLIGNALKFHREGVPPIIKVRGRLAGESSNGGAPENARQYEITVEDNGIGFDEKYLDRIFTPFQRLHGRGVYDGTGIGLAVCRKIAERHGGTLTARSTPGEGSTFVVTLPAKQT